MLGAFACAALIAACHADLDWRELTPPSGGFTVMLPGRITQESRALAALGGATLHQWSARGRDSILAAGYADVPGLDSSTMSRYRDALLANLAGAIDAERALSLDGAPGRETRATGAAGGGPVKLRLALYVRGARLYQVALIGRPGDLSDDEADSFFVSFRFREAPQ